MKETYCQSCGMPMEDEMYATNADKSTNQDYCKYCYENGAFTVDCSMDEMIEFCVPHVVSNTDMNEAEARGMMQEFFPNLKRWKQGA